MQWLSEYTPTILSGLAITLPLTVFGAAAALLVAFIAGLARLSESGFVRGVARVYVEFFRGTSLLVQLFWFFFAIPNLIGYRMDPVAIGVIVFGLSYGAYGAEIVRGSILAVPKAQYEATTALNMPRSLRMRRVVIPQAIPLMLPSFGNLLIELLKGTALVYLITLTDVTQKARELRNTNPSDSLVIFTITLLIYFVVGMLLMYGMRWLEGRANANVGRPVEPMFKGVKWLRNRRPEEVGAR